MTSRYSENSSGLTCSVCGMQMPREFVYGIGRPPAPVHCEGSLVAWTKGNISNPHHGRRRHPDCWRCHRSMGCDQCVSDRETICKPCVVYVYPHQLAERGPFVNTPQAVQARGGVRAPQVDEYPAAFRTAYQRYHAACGPQCWCHRLSRDMAVVREFLQHPGMPIA